MRVGGGGGFSVVRVACKEDELVSSHVGLGREIVTVYSTHICK